MYGDRGLLLVHVNKFVFVNNTPYFEGKFCLSAGLRSAFVRAPMHKASQLIAVKLYSKFFHPAYVFENLFQRFLCTYIM